MNAVAAANSVEIRIKNATDLYLDEILVFFPEEPSSPVDYGFLEKGAESLYKEIPRAYRYAHVEVKAGGQSLFIRPIDYVGEQELAACRFTYVLKLFGETLAIELQKDEC